MEQFSPKKFLDDDFSDPSHLWIKVAIAVVGEATMYLALLLVQTNWFANSKMLIYVHDLKQHQDTPAPFLSWFSSTNSSTVSIDILLVNDAGGGCY